MISVLETHKEVIEKYKGALAVHIAGYKINSNKDGMKEYLQNLLRITNTIGYPLGMKTIEKCNPAAINTRKKIELDFNLKRINVNKEILDELKTFDGYMKVVKSIIASIFIEHVKIIANSNLENNKSFTNELNWTSILEPVDVVENPRQYFGQKYIQDAISFSEAISDKALNIVENYIDELGDANNE